jgi:hypothetical protein
LCCVDTRHHALALRSLARSRRGIAFAKSLLLTDAVPDGIEVPPGIEVRRVARIASRDDYSRFLMKGLFEHVATPYVLVTQWDGYAVNPAAWRDDFLTCDYIGAAWPYADSESRIGNGGFSLRSRRLLEVLQREEFTAADGNEDQLICGRFRRALMSDHAIRFATEALAASFSFETDPRHVLGGTPVFGFHGLFNLFAVETQEEIARLADLLPDDVLRYSSCMMALSNCANFKQWDAAIALGTRMLEADSDNARAAELVTAARTLGAAERGETDTSRPSMAARLVGRWLARR